MFEVASSWVDSFSLGSIDEKDLFSVFYEVTSYLCFTSAFESDGKMGLLLLMNLKNVTFKKSVV